MIEYQLIRSARRTLTVQIGRDGSVIVRAPRLAPRERIESFLREKSGWIEEKRAFMLKNREKASALLAECSAVPFLGRTLTVRLYDAPAALLSGSDLFLPRRRAREAFLRWREAEARLILEPMVREWSRRTGISFTTLTFGSAASRWGSMRSDGAMRLNTALLHCPPRTVDYVIVHELCHRLHPDHSPAFHAEVRRRLPGADSLRAELKRLGPPLQPEKEES